MDTLLTSQKNEDLSDTLIAISVIAKLLARKVKEDEINEQNKTTA